MGGDSLLMLVWRAVENGFTGKWKLEVWIDYSRLSPGA